MEVWPALFERHGAHASVVPLSAAHVADLTEAAADGDLHRLWFTTAPRPEDVEAEIERRLGLRAKGSMLPFAVLTPDGKAVGMTTYMNIDAANRRVEIGSTWYRKAVQRTPLNTECKLMLLAQAFEELDCIAVEFRTHFMNRASRRAIERLGAKLDGIMRAHQIVANGTIRDTAVYSIIAPEWPAVKANLEWMLEAPRQAVTSTAHPPRSSLPP